MNLSWILQIAVEKWASDIILSSGNFPSLKLGWEIFQLTDMEKVESDTLKEEMKKFIPPHLFERFMSELELDFSMQVSGLGRFRVNGFKDKGGLGLVFRVIPSSIPEFDTLGIPEVIKSFSDRKSWLLLVTWGVGSWKSTTLAAIINEINKHHKKHIITIEDPIEFMHQSKESIIEQREVGSSTKSFENGLKYALRQASDVIMVGEMRDLETFRLALRAAETGNLVLATLHTSWAARTISRIIDMFPWDEKAHIRAQVAESLIWVVWQDLVKVGDNVRLPATEVMIKNKAIENMIRENHVHQINGAIETWNDDGMIPMKRCLKHMKESGKINQEIFDKYMNRYGLSENSND